MHIEFNISLLEALLGYKVFTSYCIHIQERASALPDEDTVPVPPSQSKDTASLAQTMKGIQMNKLFGYYLRNCSHKLIS